MSDAAFRPIREELRALADHLFLGGLCEERIIACGGRVFRFNHGTFTVRLHPDYIAATSRPHFDSGMATAHLPITTNKES